MNDNKRKELFRDSQKGKVAGICAGVANYFGWEIWLIRIAFTTGLILNFPLFIVIYIAAWLILSKDSLSLMNNEKRSEHSTQNHSSHTKQSEKAYENTAHSSHKTHFSKGSSEQIKVKARVWQAGEPPKKALKEIYGKFKVLETKINTMEKHVTSSNFDLSREIDKL